MQHARRPSSVNYLGFGSHALFNINFLFAFDTQSISECLGEQGRGDTIRLLDPRFVL